MLCCATFEFQLVCFFVSVLFWCCVRVKLAVHAMVCESMVLCYSEVGSTCCCESICFLQHLNANNYGSDAPLARDLTVTLSVLYSLFCSHVVVCLLLFVIVIPSSIQRLVFVACLIHVLLIFSLCYVHMLVFFFFS